MAANDFSDRYFALTNQDPYIQSVARPGQTITKKSPYSYGFVIGDATAPLNLGVSVSRTLITLADSDFVMTSLAAEVIQDANSDGKFNRNLTLQIQDTSTGKFFFSQPTVMSLIAGGGGFPLMYPAPRVIRPNTGLLFTVTNRDTAQNYLSMFVTLGGSRLFYGS